MRKAGRQGRLQESVKELDSRLARADSLLETEVAPLCRPEPGRSEVYRDKNTLVEVTIHRRPKGGASTGRASAPAAGRVEGRVEGRTVEVLLKELRGLVGRDSGPVGELRRFMEELEGPSWREPQKRGGCQVAGHRGLEDQLARQKGDLERQKAEVTRYKHEYSVVYKQAELRRGEVEGLETQVVDLKKIVSRLTKNNSELLGIVAEKINYEEKIGGLEARAATLAHQVEGERRRAGEAERRLEEADREAAGLRAVTAELRAGLQHGLAGLQASGSRPGSAHRGDKTREILGASVFAGRDSASEDSAIDDPNSESLKRSPVRREAAGGSPARREAAGGSPARREAAGRPAPHTPPTKQTSRPASGGPGAATGLGLQPSSQFQPYSQFQPSSQFQPAAPQRLQSAPAAPPGGPYPPLAPQAFSAPGSLLPPPEVPRAASRSSTLLASSAAGPGPALAFQPAALELSETMSATELDGPGEVAREVAGPAPPPASSKGSLESKVQEFLARLHQDSLNLSLEIPQAKSFAGPTMHLSLSGSELDGDDTGLRTNNTTLTEGKFLRGLETSIEVLHRAESSQSDLG